MIGNARADPADASVRDRRRWLATEIARVHPGARVRLLPASDSGRHLVARVVFPTRQIGFAKAPIDPKGSVDDEIRALRAARAMCVPRLLHPARGTAPWFMTAHLPGQRRRAWSQDELRSVATALADLHAVRLPEGLRALPGGATLPSTVGEGQRAIEILRRAKLIDAAEARAASKALAAARERLEDLLDLDAPEVVLCHGDARAPNVFFAEGRAWLLDFEHCGRGDPAIDLARTAAYERLVPHALFLLCDAYAERAGDDAAVDRAIALLPAMKIVLSVQARRFSLEAERGRIVRA